MSEIRAERETAVHLRRTGQPTKAVAAELGRSEAWVRKWWRRYQVAGWAGLADVSRAPQQHGTRLSSEQRAAIMRARSELEAAAANGTGLKYVGGRAVRTRLKEQQVSPLPSVPTIERVLREAGMTRAKARPATVTYPRLTPQQPLEVIQIDHLPHFLQGGARVFCFNAIDVVSRYPTGQVYAHRRALDAMAFLIHLMQTIGIARYTQVDNEGCFSGGFTHPYVIGQFARLALQYGSEVVFSPVYHPQSNGTVERFHQDYQSHVWADTYLSDSAAVQAQAAQFFARYRHSGHHSGLAGQTPHEAHHAVRARRLVTPLNRPAHKRPIYAGRLHFMRRVQPDGTVSVLNVDWHVPDWDPLQGVWVTVELRPEDATLTIYDAAPDVPDQRCITTYPFPVTESVLPEPERVAPALPAAQASGRNEMVVAPNQSSPTPRAPGTTRAPQPLIRLMQNASTRIKRRLHATMY